MDLDELGRDLASYREQYTDLMDGLALPEPVTAADLERADEVFRRRAGIPLPDDLRRLWLVVNGMGAGGLEVFGTRRRERRWVEEGFLDLNDDEPIFPHLILVGSLQDEYLAYQPSGRIDLVDAVAGDLRPGFPRLAEVVHVIVRAGGA